MRRKPLLAGVMAFLLLHSPAVRAEIRIVDSLEWRSADSTYIVQARVSDITETPGRRGQVIYRDLQLADVKVLKGDLKPQNIALRLRILGDDPSGTAWKTSGDTFIFFLEPGKNENDSEMGGHHVLRDKDAWIDLDHPQHVYSADMKEEKSTDEILKRIAASQAIKKDPVPVGEPNYFKPQKGYVRLEIPMDAPLFKQVFSGSACYINVPADEKAYQMAIKLSQSKSVSERIQAAGMLLNFPAPESKKILTEMLADDAVGESYSRGELIAIVYPVRQAAYDTLVEMGQKTDRPVLERPPTPAELNAYRAKRSAP